MEGNQSMDKTADDKELQLKRNDFYDKPLAHQMKEIKAFSISDDKAMGIALFLAFASCVTILIQSIWIFMLIQIVMHLILSSCLDGWDG